jgi:hypothetical protein
MAIEDGSYVQVTGGGYRSFRGIVDHIRGSCAFVLLEGEGKVWIDMCHLTVIPYAPTYRLDVPMEVGGRPVLPGGWRWDGFGVAVAFADGGFNIVDASSFGRVLCTRDNKVVSGPIEVILACIADARIAGLS